MGIEIPVINIPLNCHASSKMYTRVTHEFINVPFVTGDGWGMQGGAPNGLGGGGNPGMGGPPMGGNNQGNQSNMSGNKTSTQVTIPKDVSPLDLFPVFTSFPLKVQTLVWSNRKLFDLIMIVHKLK